MTSVFLHQSEFGSYFCGANTRGHYVALRGDLDIREKTKMAEDGESSLDNAFVKVCDIFGFEKLNKHQEEAIRQVVELKVDVFVNLPTGYGKSVVFQALPTVFASVDKCEKNIVIVISPLINLMKDQVSRLSLLGVSAISLSDISSAAEIKKVESGEFSIVYGSPESWLGDIRWRRMLSLTFFSIALAMHCSKPEAMAFPRTARSSFNSFRTVLLGYSTERYTFVSVIDRSEISRGVFGVEDDIGHNCIGPTIPDDCTQFGARKIESGAIGLMAPKPKTGGSFVKADTQTLSGGFKLTGNGGPREISPDGLESKLKLFLASGAFVESFDNLLIRRGPLLSNFCLIPSTIWLTFFKALL